MRIPIRIVTLGIVKCPQPVVFANKTLNIRTNLIPKFLVNN